MASAETVRATDLDGSFWSTMSAGKLGDLIIEFRSGDELPVTLTAEGDLMQTTQSSTSYVGIKRNFWLKVQKQAVQISFDGVIFKEISEALTGSLNAEAGSQQNGGVANTINVVFKAFVK